MKSSEPKVYLRFTDQSINKNLYSAPKSSLLRGTPDPGQAEINSLQKLLKLRKCGVLHTEQYLAITTNRRKKSDP